MGWLYLNRTKDHRSSIATLAELLQQVTAFEEEILNTREDSRSNISYLEERVSKITELFREHIRNAEIEVEE
ncbi:hypothetical protein OESDEN_15248 [Oesophagostomum dentatum]|uniref:Uncharacterized protein n=1 Tax=Oesophagostomum dentatum TaxID=61180 RepID=A0A0B1SP01_OESDE|nr:hypothetical protein OESDEN_15335 [Oesophagostomum dentatum]KHJ85031.1 hypothetical protein OESDEN_15248 [Oesophagostomum dentatum]